MTVDAFLQAFRRFASRRSLPSIMISDNASTYQCAAKELQALFDSPTVQNYFLHHSVQWRFIPKRAPWYGGFWERLVGLTKNVLKKVLGRAKVTYGELATILTEVEAVLNDRPLTYMSSSIEDDQPLTPSQLIYGRRITTVPHEFKDAEELSDPNFGNRSHLTKRFALRAQLLKHFWQRWKNEYLTSLREFHTTRGYNKEIIKVGDIVQIHDDSPRVNWKLARVESLMRGNDGLVRAATLITSSGHTNRPISKLYPLEVCAEPISEDTHPSITPERSFRNVRVSRKCADDARKRIKEWTSYLSGPPEDVGENE